MAKKKVNKDAWLTTYGDMITLVLTFFILYCRFYCAVFDGVF